MPGFFVIFFSTNNQIRLNENNIFLNPLNPIYFLPTFTFTALSTFGRKNSKSSFESDFDVSPIRMMFLFESTQMKRNSTNPKKM